MSLFADDMMLYIENPKDTTKNLLELINEFSKVAGHKINIQESVYFYTLITNYQKDKLRKQIIYNCIKKNKIPMIKFNQIDERPVQ